MTGAITPHVQYVTVQPDQVVFNAGDTIDLTGKNRWIADDTNPSLEQRTPAADNIVEAVNNDESFVTWPRAARHLRQQQPARRHRQPRRPGDGGRGRGRDHHRDRQRGHRHHPASWSAAVHARRPAAAAPGSTATATTAFPTPAPGRAPTSRDPDRPTGWTATATIAVHVRVGGAGPDGADHLARHDPATRRPAPPVTASAAFTDANGPAPRRPPPRSPPVRVVSRAFDNVGISDDSNPTAGNLDGGGASFSPRRSPRPA